MEQHINPSIVRLATIVALAATCLYPMFRRAKMHEIRSKIRCVPSASEASLAINQGRSIIRPFSRWPSTNGSRHSSAHESIQRKSNLPNWDKFMTSYYIFVGTFNILSSLKYVVLCLLETGALRRDKYGHLDCLLIGRPTLNPRVVGLLKYACMCLYCFYCLYYHYFLLGRKTPLRIHCLEFLLISPSELDTLRPNDSVDKYCTLLSYENTFHLNRLDGLATSGAKIYHTRPNRSPRAWRRLARLMTVWMGTIAGLFLLAIIIFCIVVLPMIVTQPGFEATYHVCVKWIAGQDRSESLWWREQVIDAPGNYTFDSRLRWNFYLSFSEQWVQFSKYHKVRVLWDLLESCLFLAEMLVALFIDVTPTLIISADVSYYARHINATIQSIISDYYEDTTRWVAKCARHEQLGQSMNINYNLLWPSRSKHPQSLSKFFQTRPFPECRLHDFERTRRQHYSERIAQVQAMVVDLFNSIRDYNSYTVYYISFSVSIWYTYSFICYSWLYMIPGRQESTTIESYLIQATITAIVLLILGAYSHTGSACCHLYKTISSVTSLQDIDSASRQRWMVIMKHYKPVPLHCFSMFRTSELSWMFVIKLAAWLFSTLFIFSSFSLSYRTHS